MFNLGIGYCAVVPAAAAQSGDVVIGRIETGVQGVVWADAYGVLVSGEGSNLQALLDAGLPVAAVASNVPARALSSEQRRRPPNRVVPPGRLPGPQRPVTPTWPAGSVCTVSISLSAQDTCICLRPRFFALFPGSVVNVHPALLPAFPGVHPIEDALAAGVPETGATVHLVDEGVDTGPVLRQEHVPVLPDDTPETLHARFRRSSTGSCRRW